MAQLWGGRFTKDTKEEVFRFNESLSFDKRLFEQDIEDETLRMVEKYGWDDQAMKSNIYPICWEMMCGNISKDEAIRLMALDDWHLAKRQLTWFRRNNNIIWLPLDKAGIRISNFYLSRLK